MSKKIISVVLAVMLMVSMISVAMISASAQEDNANASADGTYCVAGTMFDPAWDAATNPMTEGTYEFEGKSFDFKLEIPELGAGTWAFKVTDGTWDNSWGQFGTGEPGEPNYSFTTNDAGYVNIYFNSETKAISVDAEYPSAWELEYISVAGNGDGAWLNGAGWDPADPSNIMEPVGDGIWEITFEDVYAFDNYNVKFACNGDWQPYNWNAAGVLDGQDHAALPVEEDGSTVTLRIDVSNFDFATGTGTVTTYFIVNGEVVRINGVDPNAETEPETTEPETDPVTDPVTDPETDPVTEPVPTPGADTFTVTALSNIAEPVSQTYSKEDSQVTVTYYLHSDLLIADAQFYIYYDPSILKINDENNVHPVTGGEINFTPVFDKGGKVSNIRGLTEGLEPGQGTCNAANATDGGYDFTGELGTVDTTFLTITFDIVGNYDEDTEVMLDVYVITAIEKYVNGQPTLLDYIYHYDVLDAFKANTTTSAALSEAAVIPTTEPTSAVDPEPGKDTFTVTAKSNISESVSKTYSKEDNQVTVTYYLHSDLLIADAQFYIYYDPSILKINDENNVHPVTGGEINFTPVFDKGGKVSNIRGLTEGLAPGQGTCNAANATDGGYDFTGELGTTDTVFLTITFDIIGNYDQDTEINLDVYVLTAIEKYVNGQPTLLDYIYHYDVLDAFKANTTTLTTLSEPAEVPVETEPETTEPETTEPTTAPEPPVTEPTTAPEPPVTEPTTAEPPVTEPTTAPEPPVTEPTTAPEPPVTEPTTVPEPPVTEPTTAPEPPVTEPTTAEPTVEPTDAPVDPTDAPVDPTDAPVDPTDAPTEAPTATPDPSKPVGPGTSTSDQPEGPSAGNGTVQTSDTSMAFVLLVLLVAATGVVIVLRKRETE